MLLFVSLDSMPYDRVVDGQFVHATGYAIVDHDGFATNLYEDSGVSPCEDDLVISEAEYERYRKQWF